MRLIKKIVNALLLKAGYKLVKSKYYKSYSAVEMQKASVYDLSEHPIVFDVGAYDGRTALKYKGMFPNSRIYSFEPFEESFQKLLTNTNKLSNIFGFNFALGDFEGKSFFYSNEFSPTNSLLKPNINAEELWGKKIFETKEVVEVTVRKLDSVLKDLNLSRIDLLKIDVQGAEPLVLAGAEESIKSGKIKLIFTEIITAPTYDGQLGLSETVKLLYGYGFTLVGIFNYSFSPTGELRQVDALFKFIHNTRF